LDIAAFSRVWFRRIASLRSDARLAANAGSFLRLARTRLVPAGRREVAVSLRVDETTFDVFLRPRSSDAIVVTETFVGRYHLPPIPLAGVRTILDLGANIGLTMAHLAALCPDARVVGVELDGNNAQLAQRNVARWSDRCLVIEGAVWVRDELLRYRLAEGEECGAVLAEDGPLEVKGFALGTLLARIGWDSVDYVKMDIEGAERTVLNENTEWASRVRSIKVETHDGYGREECAADLERLGFSRSLDPRHAAAVSGVRLA
jgi:FkbM family methyltransferase